MSIRASRPHNPTAKQFLSVADAIARSMGWKDHADAMAHRGKDGKIGRGPNYKAPKQKGSR